MTLGDRRHFLALCGLGSMGAAFSGSPANDSTEATPAAQEWRGLLKTVRDQVASLSFTFTTRVDYVSPHLSNARRQALFSEEGTTQVLYKRDRTKLVHARAGLTVTELLTPDGFTRKTVPAGGSAAPWVLHEPGRGPSGGSFDAVLDTVLPIWPRDVGVVEEATEARVAVLGRGRRYVIAPGKLVVVGLQSLDEKGVIRDESTFKDHGRPAPGTAIPGMIIRTIYDAASLPVSVLTWTLSDVAVNDLLTDDLFTLAPEDRLTPAT